MTRIAITQKFTRKVTVACVEDHAVIAFMKANTSAFYTCKIL